MTKDPVIAIVGAGNVGGALGERLGKAGYEVRFGTKEPADANDALARAGANAKAFGVREAIAGADVVFVALPATAAVDALRAAGDLAGKIVVDCTNPVARAASGPPGPAIAPPDEGSVTAALAKALPEARVLKGWNTFGAEIHADPRLAHGEAADVLLAGDDADAKTIVSAIATKAGFVSVDAGPLRNAALLESFAVVWIHLAMAGGRGRQWAFKILGRG
jgi:hypothetical protein